MTTPTHGTPFELRNIHEGESSINRDETLFKYSPATPEELLADGEVITVLAKQTGRVPLMHDYSHVSKTGRPVRFLEAEEMRLVSTHPSVPVPEAIYAQFNGSHGDIIAPRNIMVDMCRCTTEMGYQRH